MDTTTREDRQVEEAKASLLARIDEIGRRIKDAREKLDVRGHIAAHPLAAVGIAFALGAGLGMLGGKQSAGRGLGNTIKAALGAILFGAVKDFALQQITGAAKQWMGSTTSREPDVDSFLEH